jgi:hypothetical protein
VVHRVWKLFGCGNRGDIAGCFLDLCCKGMLRCW